MKVFTGRMKVLAISGLGLLAPAVQAQSPYISKVYDYRPAPGQFINTMPYYNPGDTQDDMNRKAEKQIAGSYHNEGMVSLGGYGGYIVFGFDHEVRNEAGKYDFRILGNAFYSDANPNGEASREGGGCEPGIVMVSHDANGNGLPDDPWYELAGSEYNRPQTVHNYRITYYKPDENKTRDPDPDYPPINDRTYIHWTTNGHGEGYLYRNVYHSQSYYPLWEEGETLAFEGTKLANNAVDESGIGRYYVLYAYHWGYADNHPNTDNRSAFNIEWAVDADGNRVSLPGIRFVKVYTGLNQYNGWLGEASTELSGAIDLHIAGGDAAVPIFVSGITLDCDAAELPPGETLTLRATIAPGNATNQAITWKSLDKTIATVNAEGLVTACMEGVATIRAIAHDGYYIAECRITVKTPDPDPVAVTGVSLYPTTLTLQPGEEASLAASVEPYNATNPALSWRSLSEAIATVDANGRVTATAEGTTEIEVITQDGHYTAQCLVTVKKTPDDPGPQPGAVTGVSLDRATLTLEKGAYTTLRASVEPEDATHSSVDWSSSDTQVAEVTVNGLVLACAVGTADITATTVDGGFTATCRLTVTYPAGTPLLADARPQAFYAGGSLHLIHLEGYTCTVISVAGRQLQTFRLASPDERQACNLPPGVYLLAARKQGEARLVFQLIIK